MRQPDEIVDVTITLWNQLAHELTPIIGKASFQSLYSRSVHLINVTFPWLMLSQPPQQASSQFADLKTSLEARDSAEASVASITLLITFSDTLALLIGELFATSILRSAWGDDALGTVEKEHPQ